MSEKKGGVWWIVGIVVLLLALWLLATQLNLKQGELGSESWADFKREVSGETLQEITKMVEEPESLLIQSEAWEDDFVNSSYGDNYPYEWNTRWTAIGSYLNSGRLKALALQAPGGAVHLYRPGATPFYAASVRCDREHRTMNKFTKRLENDTEVLARQGRHDAALLARRDKARRLSWRKRQRCSEIHNADIRAAYNSAELFEDAAALPPMRYRVHVWDKDITFRGRSYRLRQLDIYDNQSGERIAWAQTYFRWKPAPPKWDTVPCNFTEMPEGVRLREFAEKVLFEVTDRRKQAEKATEKTTALASLLPPVTRRLATQSGGREKTKVKTFLN